MELREVRFRAMGCPCAVHLIGAPAARLEAAAEAAVCEAVRLEHKYSRYRDDSLTARINRSAGDPEGVRVDPETAGLLDYAATCCRESGGLFDITSGILRRVWNLRAGRLPEPSEVNAVLGRVGWPRVHWNRPRLVLPVSGMELDFGGYVKEYAADRIARLCRTHGVDHGLVDLGGDLAVVGPRPGGEPWRVGVRDPAQPERAAAWVALFRGGLATSGDYERSMVVAGRRYGHILDPRSGWPVDGPASVSVVASHCLIAGTAATVAMLKGSEDGPRWLDALGLPTLCISHDGRRTGSLLPGAPRCETPRRRAREPGRRVGSPGARSPGRVAARRPPRPNPRH